MSYESCLSILGDEMAKEALTSEEVLSQLRKHKPELEEKFGVKTLALVTSTIQEQARADGCIDVLVTFDAPATVRRSLVPNSILKTC